VTRQRTRLHHGTSGFAYKEWKGRFYPADLPASRMLAWYAERFPAVEINSTFYRIPRPDVLEQWATQVTDGFVFSFKASRWITHMKRLLDPAEPIRFLLDNTSQLGAARGPFLFQLPPNMKKDTSRLAEFFTHLPSDVRAAFEFRHPSWHDDDVFAVLRDAGAALVVADSAELATPRVATADWGYLRLRREAYSDADLAAWIDWIQARNWTDCFTFFKHEDGGTGPALARRFSELFAGRASG
jgi:uncharacterized protein YecE (DUF72 family)